jgi:integrase
MALRQSDIAKFEYRGGWDVRWDDKVPGLGIRIYASGKKAFVLSYRSGGRKRLMVLGRYGADLTLEQARDAARKHRVGVREGVDPLEARRKEAQGETFKDLVDAYLERHAKQHKRTWKTDEGRLERHIPAEWNGRKVSQINREDVARVHREIGKTRPYEANRLLDLLRVMFRLARLWYFLDPSAENPADGIEKFKEHKRKRWLTPEELPALAAAIDTESNVYVRSALWLYMLSGVRKTELLEARWADIDWTRGMLRLPDTKSGEEQSVALSAPALAILQAIPRMEKNPYILPGLKKGKHLVNIDKPWRRTRKAAGIEDVRLHDLRRTVGSWMSQAAVDLNTVKDALRHQNVSTTLTYAQLGADPARAAMEEHGRQILEAAGRKGPLAVVGGSDGEA